MASRRRPNPMAWAILLVPVVLVVFTARACGSGDPYQERALPVAAASAELGQAFSGLPERLGDLDRLELFRELRAWARTAVEHVDRVAELQPTSDHRLPHGYLVTAVGIRADALRRLEPAVGNALSDRDLQVAVGQLTGVFRDLALGDRAHELFRAAWPGEPKPAEGRWVSDEAATVEGVRAFVADLRDQPALEETYNLAVAGVTVVPRPAGEEGDLDVLPFTRSLSITVVVENTGNQRIPAAPLTAVLTSEADPRPQSTEARVDALGPGEKASVTLPGPSPTAGGVVNLLRVTVGPVAGERNLLDNTSEYKFVMRRP